MEQVAIRVQGLEKAYRDGTKAVKGIDFEVEKGEIFGLLGPNGAGKTTAMRILGTLNLPTAGTATLLGLDVATSGRQLRPRIGFAMQEVGMDELATASEMLQFHARLYGFSKSEAKLRAKELLETFELSEHANRRVSRFSGGMQRRLDLAVSIIHGPEILFLDEPSTGLDPKSRADLWKILRRLRDEEDLTVVLSTHYMEEADALCDRIAVINQGEISAIGSPETLKESIGADVLEFQLGSGVGEDVLRATFGASMSLHEDSLKIRVKDGAKALLPAMKQLDRLGVLVVGVKVREPTLDDVFLRYTGARLEVEA